MVLRYVSIYLSIVRGSLRLLWRFPLRSGFTVLSALLGVAGAISSVNYALGGREKVTGQLARLGTNVLIVTPQESRSVGGRARTGALVTTLTELDYSAIRRDTSLFSHSSALAANTFLVKAGDLAKNNCVVVGLEPDYMAIKSWHIQEGALFDRADVRRGARIAVLGSTIAKELFEQSSPIGQRILINRVPFEVAGVMRERGQSLDAANEDDQIYIPLTTAMKRLANINYYSGLLLAVDDWSDMDRAAAKVREVLRRRHRFSVKLPEDFKIQNQKQLLEAQLATSSQLMFLVQCIGVSALTVSGLGVLAISWISVRERTREIGTRRALGATRIDIFLQVASESATLATAGSALGLSLALAGSIWMAKWADQVPVFDARDAWIATSVSVGLNLIFAIIPARSAARLDPIQALSFE
jgi:putative ABC transport system permease protein